MSFTKRQSFSTYFSLICLPLREAKGSATPEQSPFFLCLLRQSIPHDLLLHLGQMYFLRATPHTSHNSFLPASLGIINQDDYQCSLTASPSYRSSSSLHFINNQYNHILVDRFNLNMKAYLEGHGLLKEDKARGRHQKQYAKSREPGTLGKLKTNASDTISDAPFHNHKRHHQRVKTQLPERKSQQAETSRPLDKTHSKCRLRVEATTSYNRTIKLTRQTKHRLNQAQNKPFWGIVKDRLCNESRSKHNSSRHPVLKTIVDLKEKLKEKGKVCRNPEEGPTIKEIVGEMYLQLELFKGEMNRQGRSDRELVLCNVLSQVLSFAGNVSQEKVSQGARIITRMRQLESRNIRLIQLMNELKRQGVDVDSYWQTNNHISQQH